jgi:hypothetical protein
MRPWNISTSHTHTGDEHFWQTTLDTSSYINEAYRMNEKKEVIHGLEQRRAILNGFKEKVT